MWSANCFIEAMIAIRGDIDLVGQGNCESSTTAALLAADQIRAVPMATLQVWLQHGIRCVRSDVRLGASAQSRAGTVERVATTDDISAPNPTNATEFGKRMVEIIDSAATALLLSIGHQTGLFDTLARMPGSTSAQLADAAGLNERYVREWLGGVSSSGLVSYHAENARISSLPNIFRH